MQKAISCVTNAVFTVNGHHPSEKPLVLLLNNSDPVQLAGPSRLFLEVLQNYRVEEAPGERGPWKMATTTYIYALQDSEGKEVISYHYHPGAGVTFPHMHVRSNVQIGPRPLRKYHLPTGRVSLEEVLRQALSELKVKPARPNWREVLDETQSKYEEYRTWP
jgi:hypothetical protein